MRAIWILDLILMMEDAVGSESGDLIRLGDRSVGMRGVVMMFVGFVVRDVGVGVGGGGGGGWGGKRGSF